MNKKDFFELYNDIINNKVDLYSLDKATLLKIEAMLKEEIKMRNNIISDLEAQLKIINQN